MNFAIYSYVRQATGEESSPINDKRITMCGHCDIPDGVRKIAGGGWAIFAIGAIFSETLPKVGDVGSGGTGMLDNAK